MKAIDYIPNVLNAENVEVKEIDGIRFIIWTIEGVDYYQDCTTPIPNHPGACLFYRADTKLSVLSQPNGNIPAEQVIHNEVMKESEGSPPLNGVQCPKCDSERTYDYQCENNYYLGCIDCSKAVAIWVESDFQDVCNQPWFVYPKLSIKDRAWQHALIFYGYSEI